MTIANSIVLADNAYGTIASGLAVGDTALTFTTGHGARFPVVAAGQVLYCCILNSTNILEEVQITAHASGSDSATIVRAAGSTTAKVWTAGDRIEARVSSTVLKRLQDEALKKITLTTADSGATYTGAMQVPGLGYVTGLVYPMTAATSNIGTAPTIALDGLSAVTVKLNTGAALAANQMPVSGLYAYDGTNFILLNPLDASWTTGDVKLTLKTTADTGWVLMNDGNVGNAASSATTRANADTAALFTLLWTNTADADCAVSGGRGGSAAADYAANKTIALPKALGRALACYGTGSGLTARALGSVVGVEDSVNVSHTHTDSGHGHAGSTTSVHNPAVNDGGNFVAASDSVGGTNYALSIASGSANISTDGVSGVGKNLSPRISMNVMIKL